MRLTYLGGAAALALLLGGCGNLYSDHSGEAWRSNAGFTHDNPPPVGPPVTGRAMAPSYPANVGTPPVQGAPRAAP